MKKILFGAGAIGKIALEYYGENMVYCFCDNQRRTSLYQGKQVIVFEQLIEIYREYEVVISVSDQYILPIARQLKEKGIPYRTFIIEMAKSNKTCELHRFLCSNSKNKIAVIGDSHAYFFSGLEYIQSRPLIAGIATSEEHLINNFRIFHLGPALAYNLNRYHTKTMAREKVEFLLNEHLILPKQDIMCCFGEIDLRVHTLKKAEKINVNYSFIVDNILQNYLNFLLWLSQRTSVLVWGPIATQVDNSPFDAEYPRYKTESERNIATAYFTRELQVLCTANGIPFISIFPQLIDKNYKTKQNYIADGCHLSQCAWNLCIDKFKKYGIGILFSEGRNFVVNKFFSKQHSYIYEQAQEYVSLCRKAAEQDKFFFDFRRNPIYNEILEHVSFEQGQEYIDVLEKNKCIFSKEDINNFCKNDLYGNPKVFSYVINNEEYTISPTTLRYMKVLSDILRLFDVDNVHSIAEIGIGYGGQCRLLNCKLDLDTYFLFDLPEVLSLSKLYLGNLGLDETFLRFINANNIRTDGEFDLVISNYAFSELTRSAQDVYLKDVILKSKAGYITWNSLSFKYMDGYGVTELLKIIPESHSIVENPQTSEYGDNVIIIFGDKTR